MKILEILTEKPNSKHFYFYYPQMETLEFIRKYSEKMKEAQDLLLNYLESEDGGEVEFQDFIKYLDDHQIRENIHDFKCILHMVSRISENHHRSPHFIARIERILATFGNEMKSFFSDFSIFNIFKGSKRALLFLLRSKVITPDELMSKRICSKKYKERFYPEFFFPEFKQFFDAETVSEISKKHPETAESDLRMFEEKRTAGENDNYICKMIQNDAVEDFVRYVNERNLNLTRKVDPSLFETNSFLLKNTPTLIEYSAFFGSIQILTYLEKNGVKLGPSLWLYAIHSQNAELIHLLEESDLELEKSLREKCLKESIKCHHINFIEYLKSTLFNEGEEESNFYSTSLHNHNFKYFYNILTANSNENCINLIYWSKYNLKMFFDFCKYDYFAIVNFFLQNTNLNFDMKQIIY